VLLSVIVLLLLIFLLLLRLEESSRPYVQPAECSDRARAF